MTWSAVGSLIDSTGPTSFSLTPGAVGDLILVEVISFESETYTATALSSSNVTWQAYGTSFAGVTNSGTAQVFAGVVTSVSTETVTISYSGGTPTAHINIAGNEFSSTVGSWVLDTYGHIDATSTNLTWASLTPAGAGELYWGYAINENVAAAGSTSGYVYQLDSDENGVAYNVDCTSAAQAPVWGATDNGELFGIMVLVKEQAAAGIPSVFYPRPSNRVVTVPFFSGQVSAGNSR